jgi:endonuclease/exonuclease/phosphatase family metal-dependent hydrolase
MTTRVRTRPGLPPPAALAELALPALTVTFGLQLLRLMVPTVMSVYRDRLGASLASLALFAFGTFLLGFLAAPLARLLGAGRALALSAGGVAVVRLVLQVVPDALARWLLAPVGVVLFLWFVPLWVGRGPAERRAGFGVALLLGLALDTALHGLFGSWDYAWSLRPGPIALATVLAAAALLVLTRVPPPAAPAQAPVAVVLAAGAAGGAAGPAPPTAPGEALRPAPAAPPGGSGGLPLGEGAGGGRGGGVGVGGRRLVGVLPLAGVGPALFLHGLVWQNLGWQTVLGGQPPARAFLMVMLANVAALAAGVAAAAARGGRAGWPVTATAAAGLVVAVLLGEQATVAACLLGQAAAATLLVTIVRRAARAGAGLAAVSVAWTAGMLLFLLLVFLYYASYDVRLPFGNRLLLPAAAVLLAVAGVAAARPATGMAPDADLARWDGRAAAGRPGWLPLWVGVALLLFPAAFWASTPSPVAARRPGPPVRVMSYNLHFGYDVEGWSDLEAAARTIEAGGADVVGLQEVSRGWYLNGSTDMLAWLQRRLRMPYARFAGASDAIWGNAILSRHPIAGAGVVRLPREGVPLARNYLWADLDLGGGRLRLVVTHLHHVEGPEGARVRLAQLPPLLEEVAGRRATVLLGDFNAEPDSREVALLRGAGLVDAFEAAGGSAADEPTYASDRPERRIDYLWLTPDLRASGFRATTTTASDHRGVMVTVATGA